MQNKGAIRLFAILLAAACAYYLMFTYVAFGIRKDADQYAKTCVEDAKVKDAAKKASINTAGQLTYLDSVQEYKKNYYLCYFNNSNSKWYSTFCCYYT